MSLSVIADDRHETVATTADRLDNHRGRSLGSEIEIGTARNALVGTDSNQKTWPAGARTFSGRALARAERRCASSLGHTCSF